MAGWLASWLNMRTWRHAVVEGRSSCAAPACQSHLCVPDDLPPPINQSDPNTTPPPVSRIVQNLNAIKAADVVVCVTGESACAADRSQQRARAAASCSGCHSAARQAAHPAVAPCHCSGPGQLQPCQLAPTHHPIALQPCQLLPAHPITLPPASPQHQQAWTAAWLLWWQGWWRCLLSHCPQAPVGPARGGRLNRSLLLLLPTALALAPDALASGDACLLVVPPTSDLSSAVP